MRRWCPPMPGFPVPMLRPGGKARPRGGKEGYGGRAGGGTGHGSVESESWQSHKQEGDNEQVCHLYTSGWCMFSSKKQIGCDERIKSCGWQYYSIVMDVNCIITRNCSKWREVSSNLPVCHGCCDQLVSTACPAVCIIIIQQSSGYVNSLVARSELTCLPFWVQTLTYKRQKPCQGLLQCVSICLSCVCVLCSLTLSDPDNEETEEAEECCWGLEMDMGESALWGDTESLCCSSDPTTPTSIQGSCSATGSLGGETTKTQNKREVQ